MAKKTINVVWLVALALVPFHLAEAQPAKISKIGRLSPTSLASGGQREFLGRELLALGYVEGKNIAIEYRYADNKLDRLPALAEELVGLNVDVLVAPSTPAVLALRNATRTIPIVFFRVSDPVAVGLIGSLARPGGNITGVTNIAPVLARKRLELLKETIPKLSRIAVLWNPKDSGSVPQWKESALAATELGLQLYSMEVSSADKFESAFNEAVKGRSTALAVTEHALAVSNQNRSWTSRPKIGCPRYTVGEIMSTAVA